MKFLQTHLYSIRNGCLLILIILSSTGCGGDNDPVSSKKDEVMGLLASATWKIQKVTVNDTDQTGLHKNMTLKFTSSTYNTTNGMPVWKATGTWTFTDDTATAFRRDDDVEVEILEVTESALKLGLIWDQATLGSGRSASVAGEYVFTFTK